MEKLITTINATKFRTKCQHLESDLVEDNDAIVQDLKDTSVTV